MQVCLSLSLSVLLSVRPFVCLSLFSFLPAFFSTYSSFFPSISLSFYRSSSLDLALLSASLLFHAQPCTQILRNPLLMPAQSLSSFSVFKYAHLLIFFFFTSTLTLFKQEPEIALKRIAASALSDISKHTPELAQTVVDAGAIAYLAQLLEVQDSKLKRQVLSALGQIAKHTVDLAELVVEAYIFPAVLPSLKGIVETLLWTYHVLLFFLPFFLFFFLFFLFFAFFSVYFSFCFFVC